MRSLERILRSFESGVERPVMVVSMVLVGVTVLLAFAEVIGRYVFLESSAEVAEINPWALVWYSYLPIAILYSKSEHISIDFFVLKMGRPAQRAVALVNSAVAVALSGAIAIAGLVQSHTLFTSEFRSASSLHAPMWAIQLVIPIGFGLLCLCAIRRFLSHLIESSPSTTTGGAD